MESNVSFFKKYKWLYLWISAAALLTFGVIMFFNKAFGQNVVFYVSGVLLILFCLIRFVPLLKTTRNRWAIAINSIECFLMFLVGILMIVLTANIEDKDLLYSLYPFLIGGVLYVRASIYFAETSFFGTKPEILKFFISLLLISAGTIIMARYDSFTPENMRYLLAIAFLLCGVFAVVDGIINYKNYRMLYLPKREKKAKGSKNEEKVQEVILDKEEEQPQQYIN